MSACSTGSESGSTDGHPADTPPSKRVRRQGEDGSSSLGDKSMSDSGRLDTTGSSPAGAEEKKCGAGSSGMAGTRDAGAESKGSAPVAVATKPLLGRWEDVLLAETLRVSLDQAVARVKRVLHLKGLEEELRGEEQAGSWSLDSRSFFERVLLARLNHEIGLPGPGTVSSGENLSDASAASSSSGNAGGGVSPLTYMIGCYERAVQVGKGPAPRHQGKPVGDRRDAALRDLRQVLVTYAILTIQNPEMWSDESEMAAGHGAATAARKADPIQELKNLFKLKGAAALPQGLLDDFIRSATSGSEGGGSAGAGAGEDSLGDLFQPLLISLVQEAVDLTQLDDPTAAAGQFATVIHALTGLVERKALAGLFVRLPGWIPQECSGRALEEQSPLGKLFAFKPTRSSFKVSAVDLVTCGAEWSRTRKPSREENQAWGSVLESFRKATLPGKWSQELLDSLSEFPALATVREALAGLLTSLLRAKQAREQVLQWVAAVANHNRSRERDGFHQGFEDLPVSSEAMLANVLWAMLRLCQPFLELGNPKAMALAEKTDLNYFHGSDRIDTSNDTEIWSEQRSSTEEEAPAGGGAGSGDARSPDEANANANNNTNRDAATAGATGTTGTTGASASWLDQRNQSRIAQFEARRAALLVSSSEAGSAGEDAAGASSGSSGVGGVTGEGEKNDAVELKKKTFGTTAEFAGLTARLLHVGIVQANGLFNGITRRMSRWREARNLAKKELGESALSAHDKRELERRIKHCGERLERGSLTKLVLQLVSMDPEMVTPSLRFLRFQAGQLAKYACVSRGIKRNALGEVLPPLPMPPPLPFASLPAHLMEDVSDVIKFAAFTCVPDPRSGLTPLEAITATEASCLLSFLVLFIGSSGYMRNPYIRAKMVEALVAFLPHEEERGRSRRGNDPFGSLFGDHAVAREYLGPELLEFFVDIEFTGSHTQFYDKFMFRSLTAQLLEHLWTLAPYRQSIVRYSENHSKFVRFVNMLINDSIFHMDDAIKNLSTIKAAQVRAADESLTEEQRAEAREEAEMSGRNAKYCLREAKLLLNMLGYMTSSITEAFMVDELRARIAEMLGYFLDHLVGKKSKDLKVDNMAELGWRPREVLGTLVDVYLNLSGCKLFAEAVAGDERSYKREIFVRAGDVLSKVPADGSPPSEPRIVNLFRAFADKVEAAHVELSLAAEELGDIPERFICPIGCDLMRDPVTLPTSGQVMDRASITRHLLSDAQDPFNRKPLSVEMLEPNVELKAEIEQWIREQRSRSRSRKGPGEDEDDKHPGSGTSREGEASSPESPVAGQGQSSTAEMEVSQSGVPALTSEAEPEAEAEPHAEPQAESQAEPQAEPQVEPRAGVQVEAGDDDPMHDSVRSEGSSQLPCTGGGLTPGDGSEPSCTSAIATGSSGSRDCNLGGAGAGVDSSEVDAGDECDDEEKLLQQALALSLEGVAVGAGTAEADEKQDAATGKRE